MLNNTQEIFSKLASSFPMPLDLEPSLETLSIPKDYICLEGFRLTEKPSRSFKALFLGSMGALGDQKVRLCPRLEWLFHESDKVVIGLDSFIGAASSKTSLKNNIQERVFQHFCEQVIPEKILFNVKNRDFSGHFASRSPAALRTLDIAKHAGAEVTGVNGEDVFRLAKKLYFHSLNGRSLVQGARQGAGSLEDLMYIGENQKTALPVQMRRRKLSARSLGIFAERGKSLSNDGLALQVEFAFYREWRVERVSWRRLRNENGKQTLLSLD
ncbi:MAG: hypothetical protein WD025_06165 [Bacteriovoracaceae bacterium]